MTLIWSVIDDVRYRFPGATTRIVAMLSGPLIVA